MPLKLRLGTRASALALAQSEWVAGELKRAHAGLEVDLVRISTRGDRSAAANVPLSSYSEKGIFAKEIEEALLAGEVDFAVHSMKDLSAALPDGLVLGAIPVREDPRDVFVGARLDDLPEGARVGTGSVRRRALLAERRPDLRLLEIRGNIDTRLRKLGAGEYDAIVLAAAGLKRIGREGVIAEYLDPLWFTPDPGQGALAIECREDRADVLEVLQTIHNVRTGHCATAERAYLQALGGGCSTPIGAWANFPQPERRFTLHAMMADQSGTITRAQLSGWEEQPEALGQEVAKIIASK